MTSKRLRTARIAVPVLILAIAVLRLVVDPGDVGDWWVYPVGVGVGLVLVVAGFSYAIRLTGRRHRRALRVAEQVRQGGATAYTCLEGGGTEHLVLAVDAARDLDLYATKKGRADPRRHFPAGTYSLREGPVPINLTATVTGLLVTQYDEVSLQLHVLPDDYRGFRPDDQQDDRQHRARLALITASTSRA